MEARPFLWLEIDIQNESWWEIFDGVIYSSWIIDAIPLFLSIRLIELAENKPQHKQQGFPACFPILILYV